MNQQAKQDKNNLHYWLAALYLPDIGPRTFMRLYQYFVTIENIFAASQDELKAIGLNTSQTQGVLNPDWHSVEADLLWLQSAPEHHIISFIDENYPKLLKEISDPPIALYVQGDLSVLNTKQIAIVGARSATPTGVGNAEQFAYALSKAGFTITSGLALGIDGASHHGALKAKGKTIAVTGSGLYHIYPHSNRKLARQISQHQHGALLSEFPLGMKPLANHFPRRNRIIAGMTIGVLVVEAALKSGSLITARHAVESGREVFAIPGSIHHPLARGCHYLIKQGAKLVENAADIIDELGHYHDMHIDNDQKGTILADKPLSLTEQNVFDCIGYEITPVDMIILQSRLTTSEVSSILLTLELQGRIQIVSGGYVRAVSKLI